MPKGRSKSMENNIITVVEDKTMKSDPHPEEGTTSMEIEISKEQQGRQHAEQEDNLNPPSSSTGKDRALFKHKQEEEDELQSAKAEMGEVREENERLKQLLSRMVRDYQSLQMHFLGILQKEEETNKKSMDISQNKLEMNEEADELVSLSLGRTSSTTTDHHQNQIKKTNGKYDDELNGTGLALELGCRFEPDVNHQSNDHLGVKNSTSDFSSGDPKEDDPAEVWPPSKTLKTTRSGDDEVSQQTHLKKARVSVRARCDAPTLNDGCQWRKYGQKIAKGNPCPRAYYRCTVSPSCPVRKQVQRCADDLSILITTYEGTHNHPLPMSATAMASTTSAAASMLQSHSSTSQQGLVNSTTAAPVSTSTNLHGLNFSTSQNPRLPPQHFYFPNSSISTNNSHPTITLDLTAPSPSHFDRSPPNPRYHSTCLNFSSSPSSSLLDHNTMQVPWNNINHTAAPAGYLNYGNRSSTLKQVGPLALNNIGKQPIFQEPNNKYQTYMQNQKPPHQQQQMLTETIATATKAIASNPKFQSALAAALTSFVGNNNNGASTTSGMRENNDDDHHQSGSSILESASGVKLKWSESLSASNPIYTPSQSGIGCASSYLNKPS